MIANNNKKTQLVASLLNLNQTFNHLYELKFKGKKIIEEIANSLWERNIMQKSIKDSMDEGERIIYESAVCNCEEVIGGKCGQFQDGFVRKYIDNTQVLIKNKEYLQSIGLGESEGEVGNDELLMSQLVELGLKLSHQYHKQRELIVNHWSDIGSKYFNGGLQGEQTKELMLHIGFESEVDSCMVQVWKNKMFALSNQRYNPKKH